MTPFGSAGTAAPSAAAMRAAQARYRDDAILSASPERIVTMLYDRLALDLERGEAAQRAGDWPEASAQLLHAQSIVAELTSSLADTWDGAAGLRSIYSFLTATLIGANVGRDPERTRTCRELVTPLREAWHTAAQAVAETSVLAVAVPFPAHADA